MERNSKLPKTGYRLINNPNNLVAVSAISLFELNIKAQVGKLRVASNIVELSRDEGIDFLPFTTEHAAAVMELARHHKDPFDRALLAQAKAEKMVLVSADEYLRIYEKDVRMIHF